MRNRTKLQATFTLIVVSYAVAPQRVIAQCNSGTVCTCPDCPHVDRMYRQGRWFVLETANFQVCCERSFAPAQQLARHAESLRAIARSKWLGEESVEAWNPRCQIVLHSDQRSYVAAVGRGSERTVGSSLVKVDNGRILSRRIDLVGGQTAFLSAALPHELTHVVVSDRFKSTPLPRWADEGIAILADPESKKARHFNDLREALANGTAFHAAALLTMDDYPRADRFGAFYGQSASLTEFLVKRKDPQQFVEFIERSHVVGHETALQECYGIAGVAELHRQWRRDLSSVQLASYREE